MGYVVDGVELAADDQGYLLEPRYDEAIVKIIADAEGIELTEQHWQVIRFLREEFKANRHTPNFRNMLKGLQAIHPGIDSKALYDLFPMGPAKLGAKIAGLPQPYGKGGY